MALPWVEPDYRDGANGRRWMVRTGDVWQTFQEFADEHGMVALDNLVKERARSYGADADIAARDEHNLDVIAAKIAFYRQIDDYRPGVLG